MHPLYGYVIPLCPNRQNVAINCDYGTGLGMQSEKTIGLFTTRQGALHGIGTCIKSSVGNWKTWPPLEHVSATLKWNYGTWRTSLKNIQGPYFSSSLVSPDDPIVPGWCCSHLSESLYSVIVNSGHLLSKQMTPNVYIQAPFSVKLSFELGETKKWWNHGEGLADFDLVLGNMI